MSDFGQEKQQKQMFAFNTLYSLFPLQTHFPDVRQHFHSKGKLKWGKSAEKWNSIMDVTILLIVTITKLTKKLFCINYFKKKYIVRQISCFSPLFFNLCSHRRPFIHTCKQAHTPPRVNVNTNLLQKKIHNSSYRNFRRASTGPPSHPYGVRLVLQTSVTTKYLIHSLLCPTSSKEYIYRCQKKTKKERKKTKNTLY